MSRAPRVTGKELVSALGRAGFEIIRVRGSHHLLRHPDGRRTVVPVHARETIGPGLFHQIMRDCQLTESEASELFGDRSG